jgi:hypothetical protein
VIDAARTVERSARSELLAAGGRLGLDTLDTVLASDALDRVLERIEAAGVAQHIVQRMLEDGIAEQIVTRALQGPELEQLISNAVDNDRTRDGLARAFESVGVERLLERMLSSSASERVVAQVLRSPLMREAVAQLLESEELWTLVDEIARSPSVSDAITHQSAGFLDQVTDKVRDGSRDADDWIERAARRIVRRRKHVEPVEDRKGPLDDKPRYEPPALPPGVRPSTKRP